MTYFQELELAICFGSVIGLYISGIATLISFAVEDHREKKRKRKEAADKAAQDTMGE